MMAGMTEHRFSPRISVVIPAYNSRAFIPDAIDSVLGQTYRDFEIIIVDDGSTDAIGELIEARYPDARCLRIEHGGPSRARNTGIRNARGEFIAFLDADDIWLPTKLEKQIEYFDGHPDVAMVFTENHYFDDSGTIDYSFKLDKRILMKGNVPANIFLYSGVATPTVIVRKNVFDEVGYFDEELSIAEDDNLWIRISSKYEVGLIDEILVKIRRNHASLTTDILGVIRGVEKNIELLKTKYRCLDQRMQPIIAKKISILHNNMGYYYFRNGELKAARSEYRKSLQHDPGNFNSCRYLIFSLLPTGLVDAIRRSKRKLSLWLGRS